MVPALEIHYLPQSSNRLGMCRLPGRSDKNAVLVSDLNTIAQHRITHVICLLETHEFEKYGVPQLLEHYTAARLTVFRFPIKDYQVPTNETMQYCLTWIDEQLNEGYKVLVHCVAGLGRTGTVAACWLKHRGYTTEAAIAQVRESRSPHAIEAEVQESFVARF